MSFALKPINKRIQQVLEEKSKILSRDTAALNIQADGMSDRLKEMQSRSTWIRWISGEVNPAVILGGVAHNDGGMGYSLAKGFKEVYVAPESKMVYHPGIKGTRTAGPHFKPMAGVKSITASFEGATKALRKTVITWSVFDIDELEILTPHFLTPGKWTMLEIGWNYEGKTFESLIGNKFFQVKGSPEADPVENITTFEQLGSLDEIIYRNKGDYDVFSGIISSFEYSVRDDGGFDCTTTLSTHGISLLDAGKDTTTFTVDTAMDSAEIEQDPDLQSLLAQDNINIALERLATYFRIKVTDNQWNLNNADFQLITDKPFYGPKGNTNWFIYSGVRGLVKKDDAGKELPTEKLQRFHTNTMTEDTPHASWVRWGWIEDNILSKYAGYATMNFTDGKISGINEVKLKFRSIEDVLVTDDQGTIGTKVDKDGKPITTTDTPTLKESVRIVSHKRIVTTNVNKFILLGKTYTLERDVTSANVYDVLGEFLKSPPEGLAKYNFAVPVDASTNQLELEEGYLRNIFFNVGWLQEQFKGVQTLREAVDNILNGFNAEYQNYWQFDVVGDENDTSIARVVDKNNPRYNVNQFDISTIDLKNKTQSRYGCYQFPTWTKDSIVSNMDYSVTIPSSQVAVAALSGGKLDANKVAQRNRGDIDVQTFVKGMHKSFENSQERFFENITRIAEHSNIESIKTFGLNSADENKKLDGGAGPSIIQELINRDKALAAVQGDEKTTSNLPKVFKDENSVALTTAHPFFTNPSTGTPEAKEVAKWVSLYKDGAIQSDSSNNFKSTMLGIMHTDPQESKGTLTDLLNGIAEIKLTIDGTAGIFPGDAFTSMHLPNHLLRLDKNGRLPLLFQVTNVQQSVTPDGWKTEITGQPRLNHNHIYDKNPSQTAEHKRTLLLKGESVAGAITKEGIFSRLIINRNILGINYNYLKKSEMFIGIYKLLKDEYHGAGEFPFQSWQETIKEEASPPITWKVPSADGTYVLDDKMDGHCPPAVFKNKFMEDVMRFAMYNGILYSMPEEQKHNSTIYPYSSIDRSFQCVSYNLFKGDGPSMRRWEAGTSSNQKDTPRHTQKYIKKMVSDLSRPEFHLLNNKGTITENGIAGFYTPLTIVRRGKDIMKKFFQHPGEAYKKTDNAEWIAAKEYQQILKFKYLHKHKVKTEWFDGTWDSTEEIYNVKIPASSKIYNIWFQYFKCMFMSYLGQEWEDKVQLIKHPEWVKPNLESAVLKEKLGYYKTWTTGDGTKRDVKDTFLKDGKKTGDYDYFVSEFGNLFKNGLENFSVDNEIHKFLQHMTTNGFQMIPKLIWWRSTDVANNMDWFDEMYDEEKDGDPWDTVYKFSSWNASHEIYPYQGTGRGANQLNLYDAATKKIITYD